MGGRGGQPGRKPLGLLVAPPSNPAVVRNSNGPCLRGSVYFLLSAGRDSLARHFMKADFIFPFIPCDTDANGEQ